jgi:hypothetical protein
MPVICKIGNSAFRAKFKAMKKLVAIIVIAGICFSFNSSILLTAGDEPVNSGEPTKNWRCPGRL